MEADTKKLFNYICGSRGSLTFKRLRKHPSPLAKLNVAETTRKLEGIAENHKCFVLEKKDGQILNVKMFFKIRLCMNYANTKCKAGKSCKYWHICKGYMEETCNKPNCVFSHNFKDEQNIGKIQDLGLDFLQSNAIRNIFSKCLPRFCVDYNTSNSCSLGDDCSNMHLCSKFVQNACLESNCRLQHNFKLEPNASVLRRANLSVTMPDKIIFYHILVPKKLKLKQDETNSIKQATGTNKKPQKSHEMFNCGSSELNNLNEDQAEISKGRSTSKIFVANTFGEEEPESYTQRGHQINQEKHNQHFNNSSLYKVSSDSKLLANEQSSLPPTDREICQMGPVAEQSSNAELLLLKTNKKEGIKRSNLKAKSSNCKEVKQVKKSHRDVSRATSDISSFMMHDQHVQNDGSSPAPQSLKHEAEHIHLDSKERSICMDFILDKCVKGSSCDMHHCRYPYVWQHQDPCTLSWTSFDAQDSETLEKSFCDPSVETATHNLYLNLPYRPYVIINNGN